jgi:hypothetical protein
MRRAFLFVLALSTATVAFSAPVSVETATGDWKNLPQLNQRGYDHLNEKMRAKLFEIAESKTCPSFLLSQGRLDFRIGFAVQYDSTGALTRLLLPTMACPAAESVAGGAVLEMLQAGDYAPNGKSSTGWYQGTLGFSFAGLAAADPGRADTKAQPGQVLASNPNEIVCEKLEQIGTRIATNRVCMTRAQWAARKQGDREEVERRQQQRGCKLDQECGN